ISDHKLGEFGIKLSEFIHIYIESILSSNNVSHSLSDFILIQVVLHHLLKLQSLLVSTYHVPIYLVRSVNVHSVVVVDSEQTQRKRKFKLIKFKPISANN